MSYQDDFWKLLTLCRKYRYINKCTMGIYLLHLKTYIVMSSKTTPKDISYKPNEVRILKVDVRGYCYDLDFEYFGMQVGYT